MADPIVSVTEVRVNVPELNYTDVANDYIIEDTSVQTAIDDATVLIDNIKYNTDSKIPVNTYKILVKYLAQHTCIMNLKQTTSLNLTNNSEGWRATLNGLGLDQTVPGQQFKVIIKNYTDDFENTDDLAKKPQHYLKFYS